MLKEPEEWKNFSFVCVCVWKGGIKNTNNMNMCIPKELSSMYLTALSNF